MMEKQTVAIIGGGPGGLTVLKALRDVGFDVTVYEKRDSVGGVWAYSDDPHTTSTLKYAPAHPTATQVYEYIAAYAKHFDLLPHVQLNTPIQWVKRNPTDTHWRVCFGSGEYEGTRDFDKVVFCTGLATKAVTPEFEGMEKFKGKMIHCQAFKRPEDFKDMRVIVLGIGNSAADTSTGLVGIAKKVYLSHRGGVKIVPRRIKNLPLDLVITRQKNAIKFFLDTHLPSLSRYSFDQLIEHYSTQSFPTPDSSWRLKPAPSLANHQPVISDNLISSLAAGTITSVHGLRQFIDGETVELADGTRLEVDAVIFCTGYEPDFSLTTPEISPLTSAAPKSPGYDPKNAPTARLYQNIFPPEHADSLAYLNYVALTEGAITIADLEAMALAEVWAGHYKLPSKEEMNSEIDKHHKWVQSLAKDDSVYTGIVRPGPWLQFLNDAAGTGVNEKLGYGIEGWKFWVTDMKLCNAMMRGVMTPFMYRIFEGKRKKWDGAREAIFHANELADQYKRGGKA
ncbi:flavin monooxygenase-like protein [Tricladium varicosporioides]|nr:flavin monooxygenase-like protein [Hymenoscyphus varicosporioides]